MRHPFRTCATVNRFLRLSVSLLLLFILTPTYAADSASPAKPGDDEVRRIPGVSPATATAAAAQPAPIRVAIYSDAGSTGRGFKNISKCLPAPAFVCESLKAEDIRAGKLAGFDLLICPGGSASKQAANLQPEGRKIIRDFVASGHGYVGFCAGAYLATSNYPWSLNILNAKVLDTAHWARGNGDVKLKLTADGKSLLTAADEIVTFHYAQGPLLAPGSNAELPAFQSLATFDSEINKDNKAPKGVMLNSTAIASAPFGQGRVFCFSPHPEATPGLENFVVQAVRWAATRQPATAK